MKTYKSGKKPLRLARGTVNYLVSPVYFGPPCICKLCRCCKQNFYFISFRSFSKH